MLQPDQVVAELRSRGELWESGDGLVGMRGPLAHLMSRVSSALGELSLDEASDQWRMPAGISFGTLERAKYFESFPHWLTAASHLSDDPGILDRVAHSAHPGREAAKSLEAASTALPPAVCYHTYAALADSVLDGPMTMTAEETCWRHEGSSLAPLERGWAFRMREIVFLGNLTDAEEFRQRGIENACAFAQSLGITTRTAIATDPFFAPTSRGKVLLQKVKALKHELIVDCPNCKALAIASFNNHERFFGETFNISLPDGSPAATACVAFGIERWALAVMMTHGTNPANWPALDAISTIGTGARQ